MAQPLWLRIVGARQNNLKNVTLALPHDRLTVITGVSGSGKSSLAFDTLFAEGQWRYIESLSTYARLFLERVDRPDVDAIEQIRPAIALEQKNPVRTARSTVGTATELYDALRLLYAKIGRVHCPQCGREARSDSPDAVTDELLREASGARALICFPVPFPSGTSPAELIPRLLHRGFIRAKVGEKIVELDHGLQLPSGEKELFIVLDRITITADRRARLTESLEAAFREGGSHAIVDLLDGGVRRFGEAFRCHACQLPLERPHPLLFSFNHPLGACPECRGFGNLLRYDPARVVPDPEKSLADGAVEPWQTRIARWHQRELLRLARRRKIDVTRPWAELTEAERRWVYEGDEGFSGIKGFFEHVEEYRYKLHVRVFLSRYRSQVPCPACRGARLKPQALGVTVAGLSIADLTARTVEELSRLFNGVPLSAWDARVTAELLRQIRTKLSFLLRVGLGYLTLDRQTRTLSGGEAQRIALANQLGSQLVGTLYVLDEPSIGLHARDTGRLIELLGELARTGNTVVVVEHDRSFMEAADWLVELGPGSGDKGGEVVFAGPREEFLKDPRSLTARYLSGRDGIGLPIVRREGSGRHLTLVGAREHNLKGFTVRIPLHTFTCITGVSGSGKSTLVHDTLYRALARTFKVEWEAPGVHDALTGIEYLKGAKLIDQEPIGRTPRSNPVKYIKGFDEIHVYVTCEACGGRRYRPDVLRVTYRGRDVSQVLQMTVDEAVGHFATHPTLVRRLKVLRDVGLGYLRLGQPATTLSGGEAQRLKIAAELGTRLMTDVLYILDEPTTGLHLDDVKKLLIVLNRLVDAGNTVLVVEHHLDVIKTADWVIDLGPEGGDAGGEIVAEGTPEQVALVDASYTGKALREFLAACSKRSRCKAAIRAPASPAQSLGEVRKGAVEAPSEESPIP
ncbi:MAG: ATP-binding cassette domain-containing protein, partial [Candidatus Rokubacteria bacterium]|nr:ATP-binding cassette domain-containing protein [Candidatus Rokubacteria bacterium]